MTVKILSALQKVVINQDFITGMSKAAIARKFNVSSDTITRVINEVNRNQVSEKAPIDEQRSTILQRHADYGVRVLTFKGAQAMISDIEDAIDDAVIFAIDIAQASDSEIGLLQDLCYREYLDNCDNAEESIFDEIDNTLRLLKNGDISVNGVLDEEFGEDEDFSYSKASIASVSVSGPVTIAEPVAPKQELVWNASSKFISITRGRETFNADKDHPGFKTALQLLVENKVEEALDIINVEQAVKKFVKGDIRIEDGALYFKDIELRTGLTQRIVTLMEEGKDFKFLLPFLENLLLNPSRTAVYRLFDFLQANDIEITADGHFIAWKKVRDNFKDIHSGTFDNSVGATVEMMRNMVDEDDERTCSAGLHVCSKSYLPHFAGRVGYRIVSVKVHPRDVVSVPVDYGNAKMRTCKYVVLADVSESF